MNRYKQRGLSTVEFAIVALVLFMMIFAVIEVGRAFFVASALDEASRRGARMAAVCPVNDPAISQAAAFNNAVIRTWMPAMSWSNTSTSLVRT